MIYSMTGFASATREAPGLTLSVDLRSVNHRYLDVQFRLSDELRPLETGLRELLIARIRRGKVECRMVVTSVATAPRPAELNLEALKHLRALSEKLRTAWPSVAGLTAADRLRWPGILGANAVPIEELRALCQETLHDVLEEFAESRAREGEKLRSLLLDRVAAAEQQVAIVAPQMPRIVAAYQEKLAGRLREAMAGGDEERVRQEVTLFANRIDVDEELSRLTTHLAEVKRILDAPEAAGKRLDFLMQELNREANTLGAKSADIQVTQVSMQLKLLIEQMREQIQNIE